MRSDQVTKGFTSPDLENLQGWKSCSLLGQPGPLLGWCPGRKVFPYELALLLFQPMPVVSLW